MSHGKNALLIGATGFVGTFLLQKLLGDESVNRIFVTVRDKSIVDDESLRCFHEKFNLFFLNVDNKNWSKMKVIYGDVSLEKFGMEDNIYAELCDIVEIIYYLAAEVNHTKSYEQLKKVNVDSLNDVLAFSKFKKRKVINFVSTLGASVKKNSDGIYTEDFPDNLLSDISMGYLKSKYEAEKILSLADNRELVNIFRLGYISGSFKTGVSLYENNQLMLFLKSCIQLGYAPEITRLINLTPVDFTAHILGARFFMENTGNVIHLVNRSEYISWIEIIEFINTKGFEIKLIGLEKWQEMFKKSGRENALYRLTLIYRRKDADEHIIRFGKNIESYRTDKIIKFCKCNDIEMPRIKYDYLGRVIDYLVKVKFL